MIDSSRSAPLAALSVADLKAQLATLLQDARANTPLQRAFSWAANRLDPAAPLLVVCGHVCSGKSSLINALLGDDILPVSPVPLSAIPVFISYGDAAAVAYFLDGTAIGLDGAGLYEAAAGKINGVTHLTVTLPSTFLKQGLVLVDSPPFDHPLQLVRETAVLLQEQADIAFLLMDFKRVQTGDNQNALKQFNDLGIPVIPLVTQMDKHSTAEILLEEYKSTTMRWLAEAGGRRQLLSFVSLRQINGLDSIQEALRTILFSATLATGMRRDHCIQRLLTGLAAAIGIDEYQQLAAAVDQCRGRKRELADELFRLRKLPDSVAAKVLEAIEGVLPGAISNKSLREFGERLVESCLPSFSTGIFNLRRARERERQQRLDLFMEEFSRLAESGLVKKARVIFAEQLAPLYEPGPTGKRAIDGISLRIPPAAVLQLGMQNHGRVEPVTSFFIRFSALTSNALRTAVRQALGILQAEICEYCDARTALLERELHNVTSDLQLKSAEMNKHAAGHQLVERIAALLMALNGVPATDGEPHPQPVMPLTPYRPPPPSTTAVQITDDTAVPRPGSSGGAQSQVLCQYRQKKTTLLAALEAASAIITHAGSSAEAVPLRRLTCDIGADQLQVTIFGAVSSGKSTLANALIGRRLLLSAANRTATLPSTHLVASAPGAERVAALFKSLPELVMEVESALLALGYQGKTIDLADPDGAKTLLAFAHELSQTATANGRQTADFLGTVANALHTGANRLGSRVELPLERFREVLAMAEETALVREIHLEIAAEFLASDVHLVDTPGFGHLHAETEFQLLLDSDAVIFVSYYNQGISQEDLQFLKRLQRINRIFCRDNIFFVVTAADQADGNPQEVSEVTAHLRQMLHELGMADLRIAPLSADLFLLTAAAVGNATVEHDLLELYKLRTMADRFAALPDPGLNRTASGIPGFVDKLETFLVSGRTPMLANGQTAAVAALAELLFVKTRILRLMGQEQPDYQRHYQFYRESLQEARNAFAELVDELGSSLEGALARVTKERAKVVHLARLQLEAELPLRLAELLTPIDPTRLSPEQFKQELMRAAHNFFVRVAAGCAQEQRLAALQMFRMFVREAAAIEEQSASRLAAIKGNVAKAALAEEWQFARHQPGVAGKLIFAGFGAKEFEAGELAKQVSSAIDLVKRGDELKSTLRQALQVTVTAELADLFVAMELDLEDVLDSRSAEFYGQLCKELESRLELYLKGCNAGFERLEQFHAMDAEGQAAERRGLEREIAEIAGALAAVEQIRL